MTIFESSDIAAIRNVALVGASATGKTTLTEALLLRAGVHQGSGQRRAGLDRQRPRSARERRVQHSLSTAVVNCLHDGVRIQLLDTPGALEFVGQSLPALEAVETAAIVISAAAGVDSTAQRMMAHAAERKLDRMIIVNRIDVPGADCEAVLAQIREVFGRECLPLNLPAGTRRARGRLLLQP